MTYVPATATGVCINTYSGYCVKVIPYLARRAVENKSVLGGDNGAAEERRIVGAKLKRKLLGSLSQVVLRYWDP